MSEQRRWPAALECVFAQRGGKTVLSRLRFAGPLRVQRLFYPERAAERSGAVPCHCYLLHPPGGMASGDELRIDCAVESGAHCLLTGPAAGKVYGMDASGTAQRQHFSAKVDNGVLEWLPQETILFDGSGAVFSSRFNLGGQSRLIAWDIVCFGRPAAGEAFERGRFSQRTEIWRDGEPLVHEGLDMEAGGRLWESPAGLGGCAVAATVYACGCGDDAGALREARARLWERFPAPAENRAAHGAGGRSGVTLRGGVLMARHMGHDSAAAKGFCRSVWHVVRPLLLGRPPVPPRVWST